MSKKKTISQGDFLNYILQTFSEIFEELDYILKGGQVVSKYLTNNKNMIRKSIDFDIAFSSEHFPLNQNEFKDKFIEVYNQKDPIHSIKRNSFKIRKFPKTDEIYFGLQVELMLKNKNDKKNQKLNIEEYESPKILIDLQIDEHIPKSHINEADGIKIASPILIIAEKYRALCEQSYLYKQKSENASSRPKDFYDIYVLLKYYFDGELTDDNKNELRKLMDECFKKKNINLDLLKILEDEDIHAFHKKDYEAQVKQTLDPNNDLYDNEFDFFYTEIIDLLVNIDLLD